MPCAYPHGPSPNTKAHDQGAIHWPLLSLSVNSVISVIGLLTPMLLRLEWYVLHLVLFSSDNSSCIATTLELIPVVFIKYMLTMEGQPPALQLANTDGAGPVKRRRAALSCVECRRRKVKCDRERPCGPCTKTRSPTCTFRPNARPNPKVVGRPVVPSTSEAASHDSSNLSSPQNSKQTQGFDALLNRYIAPGIFGNHGKDTLAPLPSSHAEGNDPNTAATVKSLSDKIRDLEARLATLSELGSSGSGSVNIPMRDAPITPAGQFVKSKFYGESHWVNCIEPVRIFLPCIRLTEVWFMLQKYSCHHRLVAKVSGIQCNCV